MNNLNNVDHTAHFCSSNLASLQTLRLPAAIQMVYVIVIKSITYSMYSLQKTSSLYNMYSMNLSRHVTTKYVQFSTDMVEHAYSCKKYMRKVQICMIAKLKQ